MCTPLVDQPYGYVRLPAPMLDLAEISTEFSGALEGVTAMPRGLHARLCHAFLRLFAIYLLSLFFSAETGTGIRNSDSSCGFFQGGQGHGTLRGRSSSLQRWSGQEPPAGFRGRAPG